MTLKEFAPVAKVGMLAAGGVAVWWLAGQHELSSDDKSSVLKASLGMLAFAALGKALCVWQKYEWCKALE